MPKVNYHLLTSKTLIQKSSRHAFNKINFVIKRAENNCNIRRNAI